MKLTIQLFHAVAIIKYSIKFMSTLVTLIGPARTLPWVHMPPKMAGRYP
jgi:hypothetical protein